MVSSVHNVCTEAAFLLLGMLRSMLNSVSTKFCLCSSTYTEFVSPSVTVMMDNLGRSGFLRENNSVRTHNFVVSYLKLFLAYASFIYFLIFHYL